jgi:Asp/Glu/hydantoin racemase
MRILLLNPNTSADVTELMLGVGRRAASPDTELIGVTAPRGVPYIANEAEAILGAGVVLELLAEHAEGIDAAIIAAFGDPGLEGARELFDVPVVGLAEAAMLTACMLGRRFAIVTFARALVPWYRACVRAHGLSDRCASINPLEGEFGTIAQVADEKAEALVALAHRTVERDQADVLIFAGAPLSALAARVADQLPVPVVDQVAAAVRQAETLGALHPRRPQRRLPPKPTSGLPYPLAARIEGRR